MTAFWIKQGDLLPPMESHLYNADGTGVDLSNITGIWLEVYDRDTGDELINSAASVVAPQNEGHVRYEWATGDTDVDGKFQAQWRVVWPGSEPQTFPTIGQIELIVADRSGAVNGVDVPTLAQLRAIVGEVGETTYDDDTLSRAFIERQFELAATAYDIWMLKAGDASNLVNESEASSSRALGNLYKNYLDMADRWAARSRIIQLELKAQSGRTARTRQIVRP